jgi:hypothetical protein
MKPVVISSHFEPNAGARQPCKVTHLKLSATVLLECPLRNKNMETRAMNVICDQGLNPMSRNCLKINIIPAKNTPLFLHADSEMFLTVSNKIY